MSGPPPQAWSPPPTNYSYPSAPPPAGYYAYPPPIPQGGPPPPGPQYYGGPAQYSYAYAPPAGYYPPPPAGYAYPVASEPEKPKEPEKVTYKFVRADHKGWHVLDESGAVTFNVLFKKGGMFKEDGCEVHHGESGVRVPISLLFLVRADYPSVLFLNLNLLLTDFPAALLLYLCLYQNLLIL